MELLIDNISTITDSELIKETLWKDGKGTDVTLRSFIKRLRIKTSKDLINNIKGEGYQIVLP